MLRAFALLSFALLRIANAAEPVHIVFDTDITGDVDDVLALAMLHTLADRSECVIEAVTISKSNPYAARFVDATNTFYGRPDIPIGIPANAPYRDSKYLKLIDTRDVGKLRYPYDLEESETQDAVQLLRQTLANARDGSIVLVQVGLAVNLAALIESQPDQSSPYNGEALVKKKVKLVSVMAGAFGPVNGQQKFPEANVRNHIDSMQRFATKWPKDVDVVWSDFRIGIAARYPRRSIANDFQYRQHHIVKEAYLLHSGPHHDRPTWDLTSVLYAVRPNDGYFGLSQRGRVAVDEAGVTTFEPGVGGRDRYLRLNHGQALRVIEAQRYLVSQPAHLR